MTQRIPDINSIFETCGEFLCLGQFSAHRLPRTIENGCTKVLNSRVFRRPTALLVRIPVVLPLAFFFLRGFGLQIEIPPLQRWPRQSRNHERRFIRSIGQHGLSDAETHGRNVARGCHTVLFGLFEHGQCKCVANRLLACRQYRHKLGRKPSLHEGQVAHILQTKSKTLRCNFPCGTLKFSPVCVP